MTKVTQRTKEMPANVLKAMYKSHLTVATFLVLLPLCRKQGIETGKG